MSKQPTFTITVFYPNKTVFKQYNKVQIFSSSPQLQLTTKEGKKVMFDSRTRWIVEEE